LSRCNEKQPMGGGANQRPAYFVTCGRASQARNSLAESPYIVCLKDFSHVYAGSLPARRTTFDSPLLIIAEDFASGFSHARGFSESFMTRGVLGEQGCVPMDDRKDDGSLLQVNSPQPIILWGVSNYFHDYLTYLHEAQVPVAFVVDPCGLGLPDERVRAMSLDQFRVELPQHRDVPIVLLENRAGQYAANSWSAGVQALTQDLFAPNPILDPAFLSDHLLLDFRGRIVAGGFPGSGNGVVQAIIERLMAHVPRSWSGKEHLMGFLDSQRIQRLKVQLMAQLQNAGMAISFAYSAPLTRETLSVQIGGGDEEQVILYEVPGRPHLWSDIHRTHQVFDSQSVDYYRRMNFKIIVALRHPLDILVSAANKMAGSPAPILRDLDWFRDLASGLLRYCRVLEDRREHLHLVLYEDLLAMPTETIGQVADILGVTCSEEQARQMWNEVGYKLLHFNPRHLWKPGEGKWRKHLNAEHLAIVRELGFGDILAAQGYPQDLDAGQLRPREPSDATEYTPKLMAINDHYFSVLYDMPRHVDHPEIMGGTSSHLDCRYMATHPSIQRAVMSLDRISFHQGLVNSADRR
jgi:hypothetical protein